MASVQSSSSGPDISPSNDRQRRIELVEATISLLHTRFKELDEAEQARQRQLYREAYRRLVKYYRGGGELPSNSDECVFTLIGMDGVRCDAKEAMLRKAREESCIPILHIAEVFQEEQGKQKLCRSDWCNGVWLHKIEIVFRSPMNMVGAMKDSESVTYALLCATGYHCQVFPDSVYTGGHEMCEGFATELTSQANNLLPEK